MNLEQVKRNIEHAIATAIKQIAVRGIWSAELDRTSLTSVQLGLIAADLDNKRFAKAATVADVKLFLRISNDDLLEFIVPAEFDLELKSNLVRS